MKALITGASSGLGKELCFLLAEKQFSLILTARNAIALETVAAQLQVPTLCYRADLNSVEDRLALIRLIQEHQPDLIINNAGFGFYGDILNHPFEEELSILEVDAKAPIEISIAAAQLWKNRQKKGVVLNISSAAAFFPYPTFTLYAAAKACLNHFSRAFDEEMKPFGIRILTCCPGPINTPFRSKAAKGLPQKKDPLALSPKKAAALIFKQIEQKQPFRVIDWRIHILISLARLLPFRLLSKLLKRSIADRYSHLNVN
jgi:uncharacterized protein